LGVVGFIHSTETKARIAKNRTNKATGENHGNAVLTNAQVLAIVSLYNTGFLSQKAVGLAFGVSKATITSILMGWTWGHITGITGKRKKTR
jgi:hypothetical protein